MLLGPRDPRLRLARTCYDHLGGGLAVAIAERLAEDGAVLMEEETAVVTDRACAVLEGLGLKFALLQGQANGRPACRPCLDWSERRPHLAGRLGALICSHCLSMGWLLQRPGTRALDLTPRGGEMLRDWLGMARWQALTATEERVPARER